MTCKECLRNIDTTFAWDGINATLTLASDASFVLARFDCPYCHEENEIYFVYEP